MVTIISKSVCKGLDEKILRIQTILSRWLEWNGTTEIYGLCEKNVRKEREVIEFYNGEYVEPFFNDKITTSIGFIEIAREIDIIPKAIVRVICTQLVTEAHGTTSRYINESVNDVTRLLKKHFSIKEMSINTGLGDLDKAFINNRNMQPWAVFSIEFEINYKLNC